MRCTFELGPLVSRYFLTGAVLGTVRYWFQFEHQREDFKKGKWPL